jgi:hypothetical protein
VDLDPHKMQLQFRLVVLHTLSGMGLDPLQF